VRIGATASPVVAIRAARARSRARRELGPVAPGRRLEVGLT
jgi:hypothetical protein